ncbi:3-keto-5-aminohexanoate cleavage protein [Pelagibacterium halotolerans]|uniref:3-keto-5-aminohexanoate cleavage protein n=1 Tax=Pelagibacterium halotolerans TaxID=531813 RepID=UPI00384E89C9
MDRLLIMVAPNGARRTKRDHPRIPLTARDIGIAARECMLAGAAAIHAHVRDASGVHSLDAGLYRDAIGQIREQCGDGMVIQVTTEAAGLFAPEEQAAAVRALRPTAISLSVREILRGGEAFALAFLRWAAGEGIAIQFILYDGADIDTLADWRARKVLSPATPPRLILVAGRYGEAEGSTFDHFMDLYSRLSARGLDRDAVWMTCAFGRGEMACLEETIKLGGHVRVGFENAIVDEHGRLARDNAERVSMVAELAKRAGRDLATADDAKRILCVM